MMITRFAPSPTGFLHVGNIRMALINYLLSKANNGKFLLRIDDTDTERSTDEYIEAIQADLNWLNLKWDGCFKQSTRMELYGEYFKKLEEQGLIYPCYESQEELEFKRKLLLSKGAPPIYDRSALNITQHQIAQYQNEGIKPYYRFKLKAEEIVWQDLVKGKIKINAENLSDPVLIKQNGTFLYSFCSVVDDITNNITHIIRGEDHISNTAIHIQLFKCLKAEPPQFGHMSLLSMSDGSQLSKRLGSTNIRGLRQEGIHSLAILNYLFILGQTENNQVFNSLGEMLKQFNLSNYSRSTVKFDNQKLLQINTHLLQQLNFEDVEPSLKQLQLSVTPEVWKLIRNNISSLNEVNDYNNMLYNKLRYSVENKKVVEVAYDCLPDSLKAPEVIDQWIKNIAEKTNCSKKEIFTNLRLALTGNSKGPDFKLLLTTLGLVKIKERLLGALAN